MAIYILVFVVSFFCFITISLFIQTKNLTDKLENKLKIFNKNTTINHLIYLSILMICVVFISISFYSPYYFTEDVHSFLFKDSIISTKDSLAILKDEYAIKGQIGDNIGGLMNPFIAITGVIITGLAFWMQYQANQITIKQFNDSLIKQEQDKKEQQFENHVYKLADIYRDNVSNWKKRDKKTNAELTDRLVGVLALEMFDKIRSELDLFNDIYFGKEKTRINSLIKYSYLEKLKQIHFGYHQKHENAKFYREWVLAELSYIIIFFGLEDRGRRNVKDHLKEYYVEKYLEAVINFFSHKVTVKNEHGKFTEFGRGSNWLQNDIALDQLNEVDIVRYQEEPLLDSIFTYKYYNGTETIFSHHYRHLHNSYKFINEFKGLDYLTKWDVHAKLIRTQISNYEQILYFINSISIIGREAELKHITSRYKPDLKLINKRLITKFDIIKNIPIGDRDRYHIEKFYPDVEWEDKPMINEEGASNIEYEIRANFEENFYKIYPS